MAVRAISPLKYGLGAIPDGQTDDEEAVEPYTPPRQENERSDTSLTVSRQPQQPQTFAQMQEAGYARPPMPAAPMPGPASYSLAPRDRSAPPPLDPRMVPTDQTRTVSTPASSVAAVTNPDPWTALYGDEGIKRKEAYRQQGSDPDAMGAAWSTFTGSPAEVEAAKQRYNQNSQRSLYDERVGEAEGAASSFENSAGYFAGGPEEASFGGPTPGQTPGQTRQEYIDNFIRQGGAFDPSKPPLPGGTATYNRLPSGITSSVPGYSGPTTITAPRDGASDTGGGAMDPGGSSVPNVGGGTSGGTFDLLNAFIGGAQGKGRGGDIQDATTQKFLEFLSNPNPYGAQEVKDSYGWLGGQIDDDFSIQQQRLGEEMARRGLGNSTNYGGRLTDLNIGKRSAKEGLARDLASRYATSYGENVRGALGLGDQLATSGRTGEQSWLDRLMGFGQQTFENDLSVDAANQRKQEAYQNWILGLLGYGSGGG